MAASRVSKSQLYHYSTGKDALVIEVIGKQAERVLEAQHPYLEAMDSAPCLQGVARRPFCVSTNPGRDAGCPLGSLANELANESEPARKRLAEAFTLWHARIESGLKRMQARGELAASAKPGDLALALLGAVQGGILLAKTTRSQRPLAIALDMAIDHIVRQMSKR